MVESDSDNDIDKSSASSGESFNGVSYEEFEKFKKEISDELADKD